MSKIQARPNFVKRRVGKSVSMRMGSMSRIAKFAVDNSLLHDLLHLPNHCQIVVVVDGGLAETFDVYVKSNDFPEAGEEIPRIKPVFEKRHETVVLLDWGFSKSVLVENYNDDNPDI